MSEKLPFMLGRYQLTEKLGAGGMGVVYKGFDPLIGRPVAVKLIRTDLLDEAEREAYRARFKQEVRSAGRCFHSGIVTVFDCAERNGAPYLVMEYVEGPTLKQLLGTGRLPVEQAVEMTLQLLAAVGHAHEQGVVHRDIKPANIIVGLGARLKVTDFGIARMEAGVLTNASTLMGTPNYMAPEQARGERVDNRADLFAVGVILLQMLTGALPYGDDSFAAVLYKMAAADPIDVSAIDAVQPRLAAVTALALAKNPAERFQSAQEFEHLLRVMTLEHSEAELWPGMVADSDAPPSPARSPSLAVTGHATLPEALDALAHRAPVPEDVIPQLTLALADSIGPIAALLVTRTAPCCATPDELISLLGLWIEDKPAREKFTTVARAIIGLDARPSYSGSSVAEVGAIAALDKSRLRPNRVMNSVQALLARFRSPVAPVSRSSIALETGLSGKFDKSLADHNKGDAGRSVVNTGRAVLVDNKESAS